MRTMKGNPGRRGHRQWACPRGKRTSRERGGAASRRAAAVAFVLGVLLAPLAWSVTLEDMEFSSLSGDRTEIRLKFDAPPPEPRGYTIEQPARIALDLDGVHSALPEKHHALGIGNARGVAVVDTRDRTRVVVNLTTLVPYSTRIDGNTLYVVVGGEDGAASALAARPAAVAEPAPAPARASEVRAVDFRRGEDGEGRIVVQLSDPRTPVDVTTEGGAIKVRIEDTALPERLQRRLDVSDFATPVQTVDVLSVGGDVEMSIVPSGEYDYLAYQADDVLTVTVRKLTREDLEARRDDVFRYKGEKLSLNFQDIEVRSVLQLIADFTGLNLVASDTVSGRITLRLKNVPSDQALELILKTKGLDKRQEGNVLLVAPAAEIAAREKLELENKRQIAELAPLRTEFIRVRYASARELFDLFEKKSDSEAGGESVLSSRGSVIVDERTNSIILTDTAEKLENFRRILAQLDVPVRQVLIEARIVSANANFSESLGIRWGGAATESVRDSTAVAGGGLEPVDDLADTNAAGGTRPDVTFPDALVVDLGVQDQGATRFALGFVGPGYLIDAELSALASEGEAEVVARPKVITADKQAATIQSGVEIPFQEASSSGATSTSFKEAVLSLEVTPQITPDDHIIMDLQVNQDSVGQIFQGVPSINTNEITTQVLVENGQTVVLGGIFQTSTSHEVSKTPFLGDLPYVGRVFRRTIERDDRQELLVFITPRIVEDVLAGP